MPSLASITLADGQASPANYVFVPRSTSGPVVIQADTTQSAGVSTKDATVALSVSFAKKKGEFTVVSAVFRKPTVDSTTGDVTYYSQGKVEFRYAFGETLAVRKDLFAFVKNMMADATFATAAKTPEGWY